MDRWIGCPSVGLGVKRAGSTKLREVGGLLGSYLTASRKWVLLPESGTVVPLSQVLPLPLGVPPVLMPAMLCTKPPLGK